MGWQLIESQSLSASAASVTFSNIPQTYKTLKILMSARGDGAATTNTGGINFNTSSAGSVRLLYGTGSAAASTTAAALQWIANPVGSTATTNTFSNGEIVIPNYSGNTAKPISVDNVNENNGTEATLHFVAGLRTDTSPITSITFTLSAPNFVFGSTFTLYGLA